MASDLAFIAFDTEDNSVELHDQNLNAFEKVTTAICAVCSDGAIYRNAGDVPAFLKWLDSRPELYVWAHNCQYDLGNLFGDCLDALDWTMVNGRFIRARWHGKTFLCSHNIWPMALARLGDEFGIPKGKPADGLLEYCLRDAEIVCASVRYVLDMLDGVGSGRMPSTLGSVATSYWRCLGGKNSGDTSELSSLGSYGGRVELFKIRSESAHVAYCDVNSLYPSVMRGDFPADMVPCGVKLPKYGFADCTVRHLRGGVAMLPVRDHEGRIIYPTGFFRGCWSMPELGEAVGSGLVSIFKVHECLGSKYCERPYVDFVDRLFGLREAAAGSERLFYKLVLNNLYGRLGSRCEIERTVIFEGDKEIVGQRFGSKILCKYKLPASSPVNWAHASYVTGYGRVILSRYLRRVGAERMIYCDTDSLIFDCPGKELPFSVGPALGKMRLEAWHQEAITYQPKVYQIDQKYVAKGIPKKYAKKFIEGGRVEFLMPFRFRESVLFFDRRNSRKLSVWHKVIKTRAMRYPRKRLDGNAFVPIHFGAERPVTVTG